MISTETSPEKPLKAFVVVDPFDENARIVYAKTNAHARDLGSHGEWDEWTCRREPWADEYAPGPVPAQSAVDKGWSMECQECGTRISDDGYDEDGNEIVFNDIVGYLNGAIFCCPKCERKYLERKEQKKTYIKHIKGILKTHAVNRFGPVEFIEKPFSTHVREYDDHFLVQHSRVWFAFPGMEIGPASVELRHEHNSVGPPALHAYVPQGDHKNFLAWMKGKKSTNSP